MSIYDFMNLPTWENAKVVEEPHKFTNSIFQCVHNHTTVAAAKGTPIPLPTSDKVAAGQPNPKLAKKSKAPVKQKEPTSSLGPSEPDQPRRKRRLRRKASDAGSSAPAMERAEDTEANDLSESNYCTILEDTLDKDEGTSFGDDSTPPLRLGKRLGVAVIGYVGKAGAEVIRHQLDPMDALAQGALARDQEYDHILKDDFANAFLGEEIDLTLFPLAPGPYVIPYPFADGKGSDSPEYTRQEWDESHALKANILCKEIFKDPDVCRRALDRTITLA
ncbi:hypothetical protein Tco_0674723 [Tanacetum coccineum]